MIDLLNLTARDLQGLMAAGKLTAQDLVEACLANIGRHNERGMGLRAITSTAPLDIALARAAALDAERADGRVRSRLHGIPLIVKDNFITHPSLGMDTTCGTVALRGARPRRNAVVIDKLIEAGMIVIGKASLSVSSTPNVHGRRLAVLI